MVAAVWDQDASGFYIHDNSDTATSLGTAIGSIDVRAGDMLIVAFVVQNTSTPSDSETPKFRLRWREDQGGGFSAWDTVQNTSNTDHSIRMQNNTDFWGTGNVAHPQTLGSGTMTDSYFLAGNNTNGTSALAATVGADEYELAFLVRFLTAADDTDDPSLDGYTYEFRLQVDDGGGWQDLDTYTSTPSVTLAPRWPNPHILGSAMYLEHSAMMDRVGGTPDKTSTTSGDWATGSTWVGGVAPRRARRSKSPPATRSRTTLTTRTIMNGSG